MKFAAVQAAAAGQSWLAHLVVNPWFLGSLLCDAAGFLLWLALLRRHDLSFAVPVSSLCYFTIVLSGFLVFGETVRPIQLIALTVIGCGICLIAFERHATGEAAGPPAR
jgi:drug/metabolite transporter (DMT)-like permease